MHATSSAKIWKTAIVDAALARRLAGESGLAEPLAGLLAARGYTDAAALNRFLNPRLSDVSDPFLLHDMNPAVDRIGKAIAAREPIVVFGDYDVDGITSTALLVRVLRGLGAQVAPFLPHRMDDGYGLSPEALQKCLEAHHPRLVITVDCGTGSAASVKWAGSQGVDVIVTDHHEASGEVAPALAVVNPKLGSPPGARMLAGIGVAFKLAHALLKRGRESGRTAANLDLREYLDYVAVGTIADLVPLAEENRILARHGLDALNQTRSKGLRALREVAAIKDRLDAYHVGFLIGPRLNAAGRLGDAVAALELLLADDESTASRLARQLDATNRERQEVEKQTFEEAVQETDQYFDPKKHFGLVLARPGWHAGVIGIVASRLCARYGRPVVVIAQDEEGGGRGSCRSIEGFDMVRGLQGCGDLLTKFGGHTMAAGLEIDGARLAAFRQRFNELAARELAQQDLRPVQRVDGWLSLAEAGQPLLEEQDRLRPFGLGNATPVWGARGVRVVGEPRVVGSGHLKMTLGQGSERREAIGFGLAERRLPAGPMDVAFQLKLNSYLGRETVQLSIQDFRAAEKS